MPQATWSLVSPWSAIAHVDVRGSGAAEGELHPSLNPPTPCVSPLTNQVHHDQLRCSFSSRPLNTCPIVAECYRPRRCGSPLQHLHLLEACGFRALQRSTLHACSTASAQPTTTAMCLRPRPGTVVSFLFWTLSQHATITKLAVTFPAKLDKI